MLLGSGGSVGGPGRPLKCMACDLWSSSYDYWLTHLTSESHQKRVGGDHKDNPFGHETWAEEADSCLKVTEVQDIDVQAFVTYLAKFGTISDFIKQRDERQIEFYFVKYENSESAAKILSQQKRAVHQVQGRSIFFRRKYEQGVSLSGGGGSDQKSGIGLLASEYWDVNDTDGNEGTALGSLQATYDDDDHDEVEVQGVDNGQEKRISTENGDLEVIEQNDEEQHDLFSKNMIEHLANNLSEMSIEDQLDGFCKHILLSEPFLEGRFKAVQELLTLIKVRYPKCTVYPCGMDFVGIGDSDDPVNVYVDLFDNVFSTQKQPWETNSTQHWAQVFQVLKGEADNLRFCSKVSKTADRISFRHVESGVTVCLRLSGYAVVQEAVLIKFLCTLDPRVRPLLALARYWSSVNKIFDSVPENKDNRGRLSVVLMIFHLMNRNIIPTVAKLQNLPHEKANSIHEGIDLSFCTDKSKLSAPNPMLLDDKSIMTLSAMSLLQDFLQRFGIASLKENAVSLWYGKFIPKEHLAPQNQHLLPDDFATKLLFGFDGEILKQRLNIGDKVHQFCVQDLFDPSLNLGINIDLEELKKFQTTAWKTGEKLERVLNSGKPALMNIFLTSAEDEQIEKEQEIEKQKAFLEMHKQVQQEQHRLIEIKKAKAVEERKRQAALELEALRRQQLKDDEERKRQAALESEALRQQQLKDEEERKRRKNRDEEHERERQKNREDEIRKRRFQIEEDDRRRRTQAQRDRDEERQRLIKSEEEEQRRFVQKQQEEQQRQVLERQRLEASQQLEQSQKRRLEEEQDRLERLRAKQFEQDQWKLAQQARQAQNSGPRPPPVFSYNKSFADNGHRTPFGNSSNPNFLPLGNNRDKFNEVTPALPAAAARNETPSGPSSRTGYHLYDGRQPVTEGYPTSKTPPDQVRRDPERSVAGSNALAAKAKNMEQDDWLNTEWEEFSKSLEQPTLTPPSSFLNIHQKRPVVTVAPSPKPILRNSQYVYSNDPPPPPPPTQYLPRGQGQGQAYYGGPGSAMVMGNPPSVVAAKGPMRYEGGKVSTDYEGGQNPKKRRGSEFLESESSEDSSSSSESEEEDEGPEEEEEKEEMPNQTSRLQNPYPLPKMKISPFVKQLFLEACESSDFAYGIRGKLQTLFLQFLKEFNNRFWKNCFAFEIELDPTYQDTSPADYAKFGDRKSIKMAELLTSVPCFEENFTTTFFCQSAGKLSTLLTHAQPNDLRKRKFIRKQATPMLKVLMDEVPPHLVPTNQNLRFKVEVNIVLDYENLNKDCNPYIKMVFDKGLSTQNEMLALFQFFGKLYSRMATRFLSYCFKRWLASCADFDIKATERKCILLKHQDIASGKTMSRKEKRKLRRVRRAEKKKQKKNSEFQATSWAASTLPPRAIGAGPGGVGMREGTDYGIASHPQMNRLDNSSTSYGVRVNAVQPSSGNDNVAPRPQSYLSHNLQFLQNQDQQPGQVPRGGRFVPGRGKTFQVPSSWNRTIGLGANNNSTTRPPFLNNTTNNNIMYRRHF